jgi:hypothetical protein
MTIISIGGAEVVTGFCMTGESRELYKSSASRGSKALERDSEGF